jgi:hypothetical protein
VIESCGLSVRHHVGGIFWVCFGLMLFSFDELRPGHGKIFFLLRRTISWIARVVFLCGLHVPSFPPDLLLPVTMFWIFISCQVA